MEFTKKQAIYLQIADHICEQILQQQLNVGDKIASIREMAVIIEVNPNTVARAYAYLEDKKIIATERGIGYFVSSDALKIVKQLKKGSLLSHELPSLFKAMDLLNLSFKDLQKMYQKYQQEKSS